jgi:lipopolysaccharide/colanic/teichoic acid biosynthesis glycosyltransferase
MPSGHKYVISEGGEVATRPVLPHEADDSQKAAAQRRNKVRRRLFAPKHTVESVAEELLDELERGRRLSQIAALAPIIGYDRASKSVAEPQPLTKITRYDSEIFFPAWKRFLDISLILLGLPLWAPLMILIAIWIKITSPYGRLFFPQERVGFKGRRFMILKFRTMKTNVYTQSHERDLDQLIHANRPMTKLDAAGDPRIIPGGRILRAAGLDELPQLFNVLRGEMSLVGPRPCTPHEFGSYQKWQQARVDAPPGLTGYWQVNGKNKTTFTEMINMDIHYTRKMSFWLDLSIMAKTIPAILVQLIESHTVSHRPDGPEESSPKSSPITHEP